LKGLNPYWRLAYNHDWGDHSLMVGTYGMQAQIYADPLDKTSAIKKFTDTALDAQYQYITDVHTVTAQASWIHERQRFDAALLGDPTDPAAVGGGVPFNASNTLNTAKGKLTYFDFGCKHRKCCEQCAEYERLHSRSAICAGPECPAAPPVHPF
jgi:hypothetical protein